MKIRTAMILMLFAAFFVPAAGAAPKADLWPLWERHVPESKARIDHGLWQHFLDRFIKPNSEDGINRFDYYRVTPTDRKGLDRYIADLQATTISQYNRREQLAYWINFYNALTVRVVLDHLPVDSITDIDISPGLLANGPWDAKLVQIEGHEISLNDIEHRILRPIWMDNRVHYAVNCASLGCPNLSREAFVAEKIDSQLDQAARAFVNHPRGARFQWGRLRVSKIYTWFMADFGNSAEGVINHLRQYAEGDLAQQLAEYDGGLSDDYDWDLNHVQ